MDKAAEKTIDELHRFREDNYEATKHLTPEQWAVLMNERTEETVREYGLEVRTPRGVLIS